MKKRAFLMGFKKEIESLDTNEDYCDLIYSEESQMNFLPDGELAWNARSRKYPTSCYTSGHRIKAGYTRSGKYKPAKYVSGKTDRRGGR